MLALARIAWIVLTSLIVLLFVAAIPARYQQLQTVSPAADRLVGQFTPQDAAALVQLGFTVDNYALYFTVLEALVLIIPLLVALLIFWRRSTDWMGLFVSFTLVSYIGLNIPVVPALADVQPVARTAIALLRGLSVLFTGLFFLIFPNGRFVPRWTRWLALVWAAYTVLFFFSPEIAPPTGLAALETPLQIALVAWTWGYLIVCISAQIYRYRAASTPRERLQTKWAVFGFALFALFGTVGALIVVWPYVLVPDMPNQLSTILGVTILLISLTMPPLFIGIAILHSRLFDIDILIRRTVTYTILTGLLVAVFTASVILLQQLFAALTGTAQNELVTVLSTLAIAALFVPLRNRVQGWIDRRFYRKKYDAQRILHDFGATVRDETDLEKLTGHLVQVMNETMQPRSVEVWLKSIKP